MRNKIMISMILLIYIVASAGTALANVPAMPTITSHPADPSTSSTASFNFTGDGVSAHKFQCKLDSRDYSACTSGIIYIGLNDTVHTFYVRGKHGTNFSLPATFTWTVNTSDPLITGTMTWDGHHGIDAVGMPEEDCGSGSTPNTIQWNFIPRSTLTSDPIIKVSGTEYTLYSFNGGVYKFLTPYISGTTLLGANAVVNFGGALGKNPILTISHGCPGSQIPEFPTVALPIAAVIGMLFFFQNRKKKQE